MKKFLLLVLLLLIIPFFDFTKNNDNQRSDIIVLLGGGKKEYRLKKALDYYTLNIPNSKEILYTGGDFTHFKTSPNNSRKFYFENNGINIKYIKHIDFVKNTMNELLYIKKYMLDNNLKTVSFISDDYHSLRIKILAKYYAQYSKSNLQIKIIDSGYSKEHFFNALYLKFVDNIKLYFNIVKYSYLL